jgi:formiminotetrahydrofolate cyclodeaminase
MKSFADQTLSQFLQELGSSAPVPGGGTAAAVAGAMGASLCLMTCRLSKTRTNAAEEKAELARQAGRLGELVEALQQAADDDSRSFQAVLAALRLPRENEEQKAARSAAIQAAYREAARVPLLTGALAAEALSIARTTVTRVNPNAISDVGAGAALLAAALEGATLNVRINLSSITEERFVAETSRQIAAHREAGLAARAKVLELLAREGLGLD